jgi:hypothetical protein
MLLWLLFSLGFSHSAWADSALEPYTYIYNGKTVTASIGKIDGVMVNDICIQLYSTTAGAKAKTCQALQVLHGPSQINRLHSAKSSISGAYCTLLQGTPLSLTSTSQSGPPQDGHQQAENSLFCVFRDLTMIDAKALYRQHLDESSKGNQK